MAFKSPDNSADERLVGVVIVPTLKPRTTLERRSHTVDDPDPAPIPVEVNGPILVKGRATNDTTGEPADEVFAQVFDDLQDVPADIQDIPASATPGAIINGDGDYDIELDGLTTNSNDNWVVIWPTYIDPSANPPESFVENRRVIRVNAIPGGGPPV